MSMGEQIKNRRIAMGFTQEELADKLGLQKSAIAKYENGRVQNIKRSIIKKMSEVLNCSPSYLLGLEESVQAQKIPVYGRVAAGIPVEAIENIYDWEEIPANWKGKYSGLKVTGDSMSHMIEDGDILIVKNQSDAETGDIVVAIVNGEDATVKKLIKHKDGITLQPFNPAYDPLYFTKKNQESIPVVIWGKVVEIRRTL